MKIFDLLSIGSRYNTSLVWEDMTDHTWRKILEYKESFAPVHYAPYQQIDKLNDPELVGVLAHAEHQDQDRNLDLVELFGSIILEFTIRNIDISSVPENIVKSFLNKLLFVSVILKNVTGFCCSNLESMKCLNLSLVNMAIPTIVTQNIRFNGRTLKLKGVSGDVGGFLKRISCICLGKTLKTFASYLQLILILNP